MGNDTQTARRALADRLASLAEHRKAFEKPDWIQFDRLWSEAKDRDSLVESIAAYVREICPEVEQGDILLLAPDLLAASLGTLPIVAAVAYKLKAPFGVWKELGDIVKGTATIHGPTDIQYRCLVIQDAIVEGVTAAKILIDLADSKWKVKMYVVLFALMQNVDVFVKELADLLREQGLEPVRFEYVVHRPVR